MPILLKLLNTSATNLFFIKYDDIFRLSICLYFVYFWIPNSSKVVIRNSFLKLVEGIKITVNNKLNVPFILVLELHFISAKTIFKCKKFMPSFCSSANRISKVSLVRFAKMYHLLQKCHRLYYVACDNVLPIWIIYIYIYIYTYNVTFNCLPHTFLESTITLYNKNYC